MAAHLAEQLDVVTLDMRSAPGEAWICVGSPPKCEAHPISGTDHGGSPFIELDPETEDEGLYEGVFYVGRPSAAPPARGRRELRAAN